MGRKRWHRIIEHYLQNYLFCKELNVIHPKSPQAPPPKSYRVFDITFDITKLAKFLTMKKRPAIYSKSLDQKPHS